MPLLTLLFVHQASTQNTAVGIVQCRITASPLVATKDEPITLNVSGTWEDSCTPTYESHTINGTTVQVNALWDYPIPSACAAVLTPWGFQIDLGQLPSDTYQTELYIIGNGIGLCHTGAFYVFDEVFREYLPVVYQSE
jgi:hypothetical protein